jgi:histidinol dehydrogenase
MNIIDARHFDSPPAGGWGPLVSRPALDTEILEGVVSGILQDVQENGDSALRRLTEKFDHVWMDEFGVGDPEASEAEFSLAPELMQAIGQAARNIEIFHQAQIHVEDPVETAPGVRCWRRAAAIEKVGLYIPGGSAPLFSTLLMLGVPARIAGCREVILCSPPNRLGKLHPAILYAARLVGISRVFKVGGVQAIGAMAFGTKTIPRVDKIFGPGNQYVTCAKQLLQKRGLAIDMPAGPSELAIYADLSANAVFVAADLLSQAEHGPDSQVMLVSDSRDQLDAVIAELERQLCQLPRQDIAKKALHNSRVILVASARQAMALLNAYAPEHLMLACRDADQLAEDVVNAGSVFLGHYSPESAGDYASGTNHVLPTNGYARTYSGVSLDSFVKQITFQRLSRQGLQSIGRTVELMAEAEGLQGHANAVSVRLRADRPAGV